MAGFLRFAGDTLLAWSTSARREVRRYASVVLRLRRSLIRQGSVRYGYGGQISFLAGPCVRERSHHSSSSACGFRLFFRSARCHSRLWTRCLRPSISACLFVFSFAWRLMIIRISCIMARADWFRSRSSLGDGLSGGARWRVRRVLGGSVFVSCVSRPHPVVGVPTATPVTVRWGWGVGF